MKLVTLLCGLLSLATATPIAGSGEYNKKDSREDGARVRNFKYKVDYWRNTVHVLSNRTSGCTIDKAEKRVEW